MSEGRWIAVAPLSDVPQNEVRAVIVGGGSIALYNVGGAVYATSNVCTHETAFLSEGWLEGTIIECPLHAGRFDIKTGKGQGAPINCDLQTFQVRIVESTIEIFIA